MEPSHTAVHVAFLGYQAPEEQVLAAGDLSLADNRMQLAYIEALRREHGDVHVVSTVRPEGSTGRLGTVRRLVSDLSAWARAHRGEPRVLVYYNTFTLHALVARLLQRRYGVRVVPIAITLPYAFLDEPPLSHRLQDRLTRRLGRTVDGVVVISPFLAAEVAPGVAPCVIRGAVDEAAIEPPRPEAPRSGPVRIVYAGTLYERYHLGEAVAMMAHLPGDYRLHVYGRGPLAGMVEQAATLDPRITFHGAVPETEVRAVLAGADVLLVLLDPDDRLARYSFPSKIFESLASGAAVLATRLPTLDPGMLASLTIADDLAPEALAAQVREIGERSPAAAATAAGQARAHLLAHGTWEAVGRQLHDYLRACAVDG